MTQEEIIQNFGYSQKGAELIIKKLNYYNTGIDTFISHFDNFKSIVTSYGYNNTDAKNMLIIDPRLVTYSDRFEVRYNNMTKILSGKKSDVNIIARALVFLPETLNDKIKMFKTFGFSEEELRKMIAKDPKILTRSKESFDKIFNFFNDLGVNKKNIIKMMIGYSKKLFVGFNFIETNLYKLVGYGFNKKEVGKLINNIYDVILDDKLDIAGLFELFRTYGLNDNEIRKEILRYTKIVKYNKDDYDDIVEYLKDKKFTEEEIKNVTLKAKEIITYQKQKIINIYDVFYEYKISDEVIKHIIIKNPKILYHATDKIKNIFIKLEKYNIVGENLIKVITIFPSIFETAVDTLDEKLKVINNFDLMDGIYHNPKNLIQSAEKTYLRYLYMFNVLEMEPVTAKEINILFRINPSVKIKDKVTGKTIKCKFPDLEELKKMFTYYEDEEDLIEKFKERKCMH